MPVSWTFCQKTAVLFVPVYSYVTRDELVVDRDEPRALDEVAGSRHNYHGI